MEKIDKLLISSKCLRLRMKLKDKRNTYIFSSYKWDGNFWRYLEWEKTFRKEILNEKD